MLDCWCCHCCCWKQLKGNVAQREVIFHWVNGRRRRRRRYTQYPSHSWSIQRWFWTFFPLLQSRIQLLFVHCRRHSNIFPFILLAIASIALSYKQTVNGIMIRARARIQKWPGACKDISYHFVCARVYGNGSCYFAIVEWKEKEEKKTAPKYMNTTRKRKSITQVATVDHRRWKWTKRRCEGKKSAANQQ